MTMVVRPSHKVRSAFWNACPELRIEGGRRLVEQDDRRIPQKRSSDALALSAGELQPCSLQGG